LKPETSCHHFIKLIEEYDLKKLVLQLKIITIVLSSLFSLKIKVKMKYNYAIES